MQAHTRPFDFVLEAHAGQALVSFTSCDPKDNPKFLFGIINIVSLKDSDPPVELRIIDSVYNPQTRVDVENGTQQDDQTIKYLHTVSINLDGRTGNKLTLIPVNGGQVRISGFITDSCEFETNQPAARSGHIGTGTAPHQYPYSNQHLDESSSSSSEEFSSSESSESSSSS